MYFTNCDLQFLSFIYLHAKKKKKKKRELQALVIEQKILNRIYVVRGEKIMLDRDLAELFGIETRILKQAVKKYNNV